MNASARRPRWRTVAVLLVAIVVAIVVAGVVASSLVEPEAFRGRIESALRGATGWETEIGELDFSLLGGALTVAPATLRDPASESEIVIERVAIRVAVLRLLRGRLDIRSVTLEDPAVTLVRAPGVERWPLPTPGTAPPPPSPSSPPPPSAPAPPATDAPPARRETPRTTIGVVRLVDGRIRVEDRSGETPIGIELEDVRAEWSGADGTYHASGRIAADRGLVRVASRRGEPIRIELEDVDAALAEPWTGAGLFAEPSRVTGTVTVAGAGRVRGDLVLRPLRLLEGVRALDEASVGFVLDAAGDEVRLESLVVEGAGVTIEGGGTLAPELAVGLRTDDAPLEALRRWADAVMPLPVRVSPPGSMSAELVVGRDGVGEVVLSGGGRVSAAEVAPGSPLPPMTDVTAEFEIDPSGRLGLRIVEATMGGGRLAGRAAIDEITAPGALTFEGDVTEAVLGRLIGGFIADPDSPIVGATRLDAALGVDLSGPVDAAALRGRIRLAAREVDLPGWDLEREIRSGIEKKLESLGALRSLLGDAAAPAGDDGDGAGGGRTGPLIERLATDLSFDGIPWKVESLAIGAGEIESEGRGTYDPLQDHLELSIVTRFSEARTADWIAKYGELASLRGPDGRLVVPVRIEGSVAGPDVSVDLSSFGREQRKDLKKKLLDRLLGDR